ncbi:MAG: adenylosuccinate synthetase, partial [Fervidicoccaceae archaeon]
MLTIIVGGFFGDEGKGSVTAYLALADDADVAVRCGSVNAGHTVVWRGVEYRLRIVPAAFVNPSTRLLVAPGALVRLDLLFEEMERTGTRGRLFLD